MSAQSFEHSRRFARRIENPRVGGSIPPQATSPFSAFRDLTVRGRFYLLADFYNRRQTDELFEEML
jgi:hypothetical protein